MGDLVRLLKLIRGEIVRLRQQIDENALVVDFD